MLDCMVLIHFCLHHHRHKKENFDSYILVICGIGDWIYSSYIVVRKLSFVFYGEVLTCDAECCYFTVPSWLIYCQLTE